MQSFSKRSSSSYDISTRPILDDDEDVLANVVAVEGIGDVVLGHIYSSGVSSLPVKGDDESHKVNIQRGLLT